MQIYDTLIIWNSFDFQSVNRAIAVFTNWTGLAAIYLILEIF